MIWCMVMRLLILLQGTLAITIGMLQVLFIPAMSSGDRVPAAHVKSHCDYVRLLYFNTRSIVHKVDELIAFCLLQNPDIVCVVKDLAR